MSRYTVDFSRIPVGAKFRQSGMNCVKISTRTADITDLAAARRFYFGKRETCEVSQEVRDAIVAKEAQPPEPAEYNPRNPKLDFYGHDGRYLYSSNFYKNNAHAWEHVARNPVSNFSIVGKIVRSKTV